MSSMKIVTFSSSISGIIGRLMMLSGTEQTLPLATMVAGRKTRIGRTEALASHHAPICTRPLPFTNTAALASGTRPIGEDEGRTPCPWLLEREVEREELRIDMRVDILLVESRRMLDESGRDGRCHKSQEK